MSTSLTNRSLSFLFFIILLIPLIFGYAIANQNFYIMFVPAIVFLAFLVLRSNIISIFIILFFVFFGNSLETLGLLPPQANWLVEVVVILLLIKAISSKIFRKDKIQLNYIWVFLLFLCVSLISFLLNYVSIIHAFLFIRLVFRYYLLFLAVINLDFEEKSVTLINKIIIFLFIIQIPTAVVKMFIYGPGELAIGTYAPWGGGPSTTIPMIAISFLIAFYFFYKPSKLYFLLALGFIAFGLIGGKRAILVFLPVVVVFLGICMRDRFKNVLRYFFIGSFVILITGYFSIKFMPSLNPQGRIGGEIDFGHIKNFFANYTMRTPDGRSAGRISTSINVFNILKDKGTENLFFGLGAGSYIQTRFENIQTTLRETGEIPILYGTTGLSWLALQTGYIGAIIYLFLFYSILLKSFQYYRLEDRPYWKSYGFGMLGFSFVMLFISLFYNVVFINDLIPMVYFLLAAFTIKQISNIKSEENLLDSNTGPQ